MNWLNVRTSVGRAPEYIGSDPVQRATWWNVMLYAVEQENGGRMAGARHWNCRRWQQTCGVTLDEVQGAGVLLTWEGDDLILWNYPSEHEQESQRMRELGAAKSKKKAEAARKNGLMGGRPKEQNPNNPTEPNEENPTEPIQDKIRQDKVREHNGPIPASECAAEVVFNRFWSLYPRQEKRARALAAYQRNNCLAISDAVMEGLRRWLASDQWARKIYPSAENWLDDHQWEDMPLAAGNSGANRDANI